MSDPRTLARLDLEALDGTSQLKVHFPSNEEEVHLRFKRTIEHVSWCDIFHCRLTMTKEDRYHIYTCNPRYHYLIHTYLVIRLPKVRVKDEFKDKVQVAWCTNIGLNVVREAKLIFNRDQHIQYIDDIWSNIYANYTVRPEQLALYNVLIGNVNDLLEWTTELPAKTLTVPQPWAYSQESYLALPLFLCQPITPFLHRYRLRLKLAKLIRMRRKEANDVWQEIKPNLDYLDQHTPHVLPDPEMWGQYAIAQEDEIAFLNKDIYDYYINDVIKVSNEQTIQSGQTITLDLHLDKLPVRALLWVLENENNRPLNRRSDYSFNGTNPTVSAKLLYGTNERVPEIDNHTDLIDMWYHHKTYSITPGYNCMSFALNPLAFSFDNGVILPSNSRLVIKVRDYHNDSRFRLHAYALVYREISLNRGDCTKY